MQTCCVADLNLILPFLLPLPSSSRLVASQRKLETEEIMRTFQVIVDCTMFSLLFPGFGVQNL